MKFTINARTLRPAVAEGVMRWPRRRIHAGWDVALHMTWQTRLALLLLWRRSQARSTLTCPSDYALEEVSWTMADRWRWLLRWADMWAWSASSLLELLSKSVDFVFVSASKLVVHLIDAALWYVLALHLLVSLIELVDLGLDKLHLLVLAMDCTHN